MSFRERFRLFRQELFLDAIPLVGAEPGSILTSSPAALGDRLLHGGKRKSVEAVTQQIAQEKAKAPTETDPCMFDPDRDGVPGKDFQMGTFWCDDDIEVRVLNYNPAVSIEDITASDVVEMLLGHYEPRDRIDTPESYGGRWT